MSAKKPTASLGQKTNLFAFFGKSTATTTSPSTTAAASSPSSTSPSNGVAANASPNSGAAAAAITASVMNVEESVPLPLPAQISAPSSSTSSPSQKTPIIAATSSATPTPTPAAAAATLVPIAKSVASDMAVEITKAVAPTATVTLGTTTSTVSPTTTKKAVEEEEQDSEDDGPVSLSKLRQQRSNVSIASSSASSLSSSAVVGVTVTPSSFFNSTKSNSSSSSASSSSSSSSSSLIGAGASGTTTKPKANVTASSSSGSSSIKKGTPASESAKSSSSGKKRARKASGDDDDQDEEDENDDDSTADFSSSEEESEEEEEDDYDSDDSFIAKRKKKGKAAASSAAKKKPAAAAKGKSAGKPSAAKRKSTGGGGGDADMDADEGGGGGGGGDGDDLDGGDGAVETRAGVFPAGGHTHDSYSFLKPENRRDAHGRRPDDPSFNPRTLYVPPTFLRDQTPAQAQWWVFKAKYMDTVLFFRQGKFYECFHMDADVVVQALGVIYMKGETAHAGFPEISYGMMSDKLVAQGYRVARVEQTETPQQLKERNAITSGPKDKAVRRDLCGIKSKGTRTCGVLDVYAGKQADEAAASVSAKHGKEYAGLDLAYGDTVAVAAELRADTNFGYLYSIKEIPLALQSTNDSSSNSSSGGAGSGSGSNKPATIGVTHAIAEAPYVHIGVIVVDTLSGDVRVAEFVDDRNRTRLRTLLARHPAGEFLYEVDRPVVVVAAAATAGGGGGGSSSSSSSAPVPTIPQRAISRLTRRFLISDAPGAVHSRLLPIEEFWTADATAAEIELTPYQAPLRDLAASAGNSNSSSSAAAIVTVGTKLSSKKWKVVSAGTTPGSVEEVDTATIHLRDYFDADPENERGGRAATSTLASGSSSSSSMTLYPVQGVDGRTRTIPTVLWNMLQCAREQGFKPATPPPPPNGAAWVSYDVEPGALALSAFGAVIYWLRRCLIDHHVFSMRKVCVYRHADGVEGSLALNETYNNNTSALGSSSASASSTSASAFTGGHGEGGASVPHMILDGVTLANLEIVENAWDGGKKGTLLGLLDSCATPMGKKRFRQWLAAPLLRVEDIEDRLRCVEDLMHLETDITSALANSSSGGGGSPSSGCSTPVSEARQAMKGMPDLERLLARIHGLGSKVGSRDHPDSRAMFYESDIYSKRKIADLLAALKTFRAASKIREAFHVKGSTAAATSSSSSSSSFGAGGGGGGGSSSSSSSSSNDTSAITTFDKGILLEGVLSPLLRRTVHDRFPDLTPLLDFFSKSFDAREAERTNTITPAPGIDSAYDAAMAATRRIEQELEQYLQEQKRTLACASMSYFHTGKDRFQLEVPESFVKRVPQEYRFKSQRKASGRQPGVARYWTEEIEEMIARLTAAEEQREVAVKDGLRRLFARFDAHKAAWESAASAIATLDCLISLSKWSLSGDHAGPMCRPELVRIGGSAAATSATTTMSTSPFLHLQGARHPTMAAAISAVGNAGIAGSDGPSTFIPNDITLGRDTTTTTTTSVGGAPCVLLTGPNMGGKSTYLRTSCMLVILAQLGAYVPADKCRLTPVDRVFTRVGASDRILAGQSTFFVELAETSMILSAATQHSLVILDELGRGTSTFDGSAIAYAVTCHLTRKIGCRTLFATHYHSLCDDFVDDEDVALGHMDCVVASSSASSSVVVGSSPLAKPSASSLSSLATDASSSSSSSAANKSVTFLFKYAVGACPKSYGLNVARLARLPEAVVLRAAAKSEEFECAVMEAEAEAEAARHAATATTTTTATGAGGQRTTPPPSFSSVPGASPADFSAASTKLNKDDASSSSSSRYVQLKQLYKNAADILGSTNTSNDLGADLDALYTAVKKVRMQT